ncbi:MAG: leucine-rich repeat protein, partial [Lachnospiraceae bacterium]|nr:leucine-rich repeat protein [Lachnospiraceae bacterium]
MKMIYCMNCMSKMEEEQEICPVCGYRWGSRPQPEYALRENSILHGRYLIGRVLGEGGFGITYLGFDLMLNIKVAIKEYFPMGAVNRNGSCSDRVSWNTSVVNRETGCRSFVKEAQKMARIDQIPEIVRVRDVFLTNETAYIVMDFVEGETLKDRLKREGPMGAEDCIRLLLPVIKGMARVHEQGMIHRDIKPDNIMLQKDGKVRLLDLGAAKEIDLQRNPERGAGINGGKNGNENLPPTQMVVSNGFSPLEQYSETGRIGPWTDVYAMCATIYYCITGKVLPASLDRISQEALPLTEEQKSKIPAQVLAVLEKGLALREDKRIQTMEELEQELKRRGPDPEPDPWWKRLWKAVLRRKALIPVGIAILAAVVGLGIKFRMEPGTLEEGTCGENLTWSLSPEGKLTIAGTGDMEDYNYTSEENELAPWYPYRDSIKEIEIGEGVKKIGVFAFLRCAMEQVTLPDTVEIIGENAFYDCNNLCEIEIPGKVTYIDHHTFYDCDKLETVTYRGERPEIAEDAFERCPLLTAEEATELIAEGTCGENLTWSLSSEGKLTIAGAGDMEDYAYTSEENELAPWYPYWDSIKEIEIGEE